MDPQRRIERSRIAEALALFNTQLSFSELCKAVHDIGTAWRVKQVTDGHIMEYSGIMAFGKF
jgi:hypothetical protein